MKRLSIHDEDDEEDEDDRDEKAKSKGMMKRPRLKG